MVRQQKRMENLVLRASLGVVGLCASSVCAQTDGTYLITFDGVVTPQTPTLTVGIWATWDGPPQTTFFGGGDYDLEASEGEFIGGKLMVGGDPPNTIGILSGNKVIGAAIGQVYLPGHPPGHPENPILLATYDWTTTDFTPRIIDFGTSNTDHFFVVETILGEFINLAPGEFTPGSGQYFVPAPSTFALFACAGLFATRRRRVWRKNDA